VADTGFGLVTSTISIERQSLEQKKSSLASPNHAGDLYVPFNNLGYSIKHLDGP